ncbi:hypothetical protein [Pseudoduganella umbonata]|uniref:Uncharacterized protein n=1 Tax=Pseudoduganella umbonata TaxID=864828 RepID=A0A4P8HL97_9BURK|nr:hypothetical protein [Pseudoduganella umbonata]MBB3219622.1 hypothetical protein [Pseudoduganella umbonata]QCP09686.1 hypothetical protein FCL38_04055 [Pseudoduganella umbonata]
MNAHIEIGATALALEAAGTRHAVQASAWLTRGGMVLCRADDEGLDDFPAAELKGSLSLHSGGPWAPADPAEAAVEPGMLPRAARWAVALRTLAFAAQADIHDATLRLSGLDGAEYMLDACRAFALLGWGLEGNAPAAAEFVSQWRECRAWAELAWEHGKGHQPLVAAQGRLPARKRFGRQAGERLVMPRLLLDGESLDFGQHRLDELGQAHEFELLWDRDGTIRLDLLIDETWRPLPLLRAAPCRQVRNRFAAETYAALAYWAAVVGFVQADIIAPLAAISGEAP